MFPLHAAIFALALSAQRGHLVTGISCYECRSASASSLCASEAGEPSECDKKYCTIYRQEYLDPAGKIQHFYRSCEDAPTYLNAVIHTPSHLAYYRACDSDLCNSGDGVKEFALEQATNTTSSPVYLVPGVGSGGERASRLAGPIIVALISLALSLHLL